MTWQTYANGNLYFSGSTGVKLVAGAILQAYVGAGGPAALGAPTIDESGTPDGRGRYNHFAGGGSVYWTPALGAQVVSSVVRPRWAAQGWENGPLGYPVASTRCGLAGGGCTQRFQGGIVASSPASGTWVLTGAAGDRWVATGQEQGFLSYPLTDNVCGLAAGGCYQHFQGGSLYFSPGTGTTFIRGAIRDLWSAMGWENSWLGYPTSDEICGLRGGGCLNYFQNGSIFWSPATGTHVINTLLMGKWQELGWEAGPVGYPLTNVACGLTANGCAATFQGGTLIWSPTTGTHFTRGVIRDLWIATGAQDGWLGYPVTDQNCGLTQGGCYTHFTNGSVYWTSTTGTHAVTDTIRATWADLGWENSPWGYPTGDAYPTPTGVAQTFQNGTATWNRTTGTVTFR